MHKLTAGLGIWLVLTPVAMAAPVSIHGSESSRVLRYHGPAVTATLSLRTQATAQTVAVGLQPSLWQDRLMIGSPLRTLDRKIVGPGRITGSYAAGGGGSFVGAAACVRGGPQSTGGGIDLLLPARTTTRITWRVALAAPPWVPEFTFLGWDVAIPATASDPSQINRFMTYVPFRIAGPTGVDIRLSAGKGTRPGHGVAPYPVVRAGHDVQITGVTRPQVRHARIHVGYSSTTGHRHGTIGTVRTDDHGRFAITWRPRAIGIYTITSALPDPPAGLLPDHNCDLALTVS